jgi:hypothetical protein
LKPGHGNSFGAIRRDQHCHRGEAAVLLPRVRAVTPDEQPRLHQTTKPRYFGSADEAETASTRQPDRGFGETLMIVDDEATVRMLVNETLTRIRTGCWKRTMQRRQ